MRGARLVLSNALLAPHEKKFRRLRRTNKHVQRILGAHVALPELLDAAGFHASAAEPGMLYCASPDLGLLWLARELLDSCLPPAEMQ